MPDLNKAGWERCFFRGGPGCAEPQFWFSKILGLVLNGEKICPRRQIFLFSFFQCRFELGRFFFGPCVFFDLKRDVCFSLFFGREVVYFFRRENNEKNKNKRQIKHSWRSLLIDLSNKNLHFTYETHACDVDSISELASPFCNSPYVLRTRCLVSPKPCWISNVCVVFLAAL